MSAVPVELNKIMISEIGDAQVIVLRERNGTRILPIWIGMPEALAIHRRVQGEVPPRPMTHDLLWDLVTKLGATLERVVVDQFVGSPTGGTFHAKIVIKRDGNEIPIDARPSDAVALAVRAGAPLFIEEEILRDEGHDLTRTDGPEGGADWPVGGEEPEKSGEEPEEDDEDDEEGGRRPGGREDKGGDE